MLTQFYAPIVGGEERIIQDLCIELVKRGHDVAIATLWREDLARFEIEHGIRIHRIRSTTQRAKGMYKDSERSHIPPFPDPGAVLELRDVIRQEQPQIIHAHNWLGRSFLPLKKWSGAKFVVTLHDYSLSCAKKRLMFQGRPCNGPALSKCISCSMEHYGRLKGTVVATINWWTGKVEQKMVDMYLPISNAVLEGNGLNAGKTAVKRIPNFVRDDLLDLPVQDDPCLEELPPDGFLLFVGDLLEEKGLNVLLKAYTELRDAPPLVLIGRKFPSVPETLPPNVHLMGIWSHDAVMKAWSRCSIALAPSVWSEPFGLVAIEAMAAGRPVIASRTGGLPDFVVDGETGYLVTPDDPVALRTAMERLLADPRMQAQMGYAARKRSAEFQAGIVVPQIERVYRSMLENN